MIAPRPTAATRALLPSAHLKIAAASPHEPVVLWFDAVGGLVSPGGQGFTSDDLNAVKRDAEPRPVLVACTYAGEPPRRDDGSEARSETLKFVEGFRQIHLDAELDESEMRRLRERLGDEVADAVKATDCQLGAYACGKDHLLIKYQSRSSDLDRDGHELVEALLAWRRGVSPAPVPKDFARRLWESYRRDLGLEPDDAWWAQVWDWAQAPVVGHVRLVHWSGDAKGFAPDFVLDGELKAAHVHRLHQRAAALLDESASEDPARSREIAARARDAGLTEVEETWLRRAGDEVGVPDTDRAWALLELSELRAEAGDAEAAQEAAEEAVTADPLLGDTLADESVDLGPFRRAVEARRVSEHVPPDEVTRLVEELFCNRETAGLGPYALLERRTTLVDDAMYRYDVEPLDEQGDGTGAVQELLLFTNVEGELGGALWDEEVQTLMRLGERRHPALPRVLGGG